jgi:zinc transport system ATP-binding protein
LRLVDLIDHAVVLDRGRVVHVGAPPHAPGDHSMPGHDHVHPHDADQNRPRPDAPTFEIAV